MTTLLEKAKQHAGNQRRKKQSSPFSDKEIIELAIAYFSGEITPGNASHAMGLKTTQSFYSPIASAFRRAVLDGKVQVKLLK